VLVEEGAGLVEVLALHDPAVALVERWPDLPAYLVADDVAEECRRGEQADRDRQLGGPVLDAEDVVVVAGDEEPEREQQGVARQEREEQAALDEDDGEADPDEGAAELVEQPVPLATAASSRSRTVPTVSRTAARRGFPAPSCARAVAISATS
jgi:hypothetical protein